MPILEITYKNKKIEKVCEDYHEAQKKYDVMMANKIHQRIDQLKAASTISMLIKAKIGRCHALKGNRKSEFAMDLVGGNRLVFEEKDGNICCVRILEITDYH